MAETMKDNLKATSYYFTIHILPTVLDRWHLSVFTSWLKVIYVSEAVNSRSLLQYDN